MINLDKEGASAFSEALETYTDQLEEAIKKAKRIPKLFAILIFSLFMKGIVENILEVFTDGFTIEKIIMGIIPFLFFYSIIVLPTFLIKIRFFISNKAHILLKNKYRQRLFKAYFTDCRLPVHFHPQLKKNIKQFRESNAFPKRECRTNEFVKIENSEGASVTFTNMLVLKGTRKCFEGTMLCMENLDKMSRHSIEALINQHHIAKKVEQELRAYIFFHLNPQFLHIPITRNIEDNHFDSFINDLKLIEETALFIVDRE